MVEEGNAIRAEVVAVAGVDRREGGVCPKGVRGRKGEVGENELGGGVGVIGS
jgi:hypothetical protein